MRLPKDAVEWHPDCQLAQLSMYQAQIKSLQRQFRPVAGRDATDGISGVQ